ncbi:prolipoprotein diacylglyceryl transferase family protein [Ferruginibacter sp. SUN106]|uniref:prolipoprotein diacylglyceryl transferase family protein n=1 Tax=Ferruginibacter sp. SUN106 TaxID=2978348 RepID=UPI003D35DE3C
MLLKFPFYITIGSTQILWHTIFETMGLFLGFRYFIFLRKKQTDPIISSNRIWILIGAIFGALIGSRIIGALENPEQLQSSKNALLYIYSNKTVVGGFLGGLFGVESVKKIIHEKKSSGDLFTYPMILGLVIGRIGCFSMGVYEETYGNSTSFIMGMNLGDNVLRHPVTLYEIAFLLLLWVTLLVFERKYVLENGARFKLFMIAYISFRFLLDFIKPHYNIITGLSTIQITCLAGLLYYLNTILHPQNLINQKIKINA